MRDVRDLLSADELERSRRFRFEEDRQRFAVTRQALRILLGRYTQCDPNSLSFNYSHAGKPALGHPTTDIRFNVTHSHECAMVAIARSHEVGVDLEFQREDVEVEDLARRFFSSYEQEKLTAIASADRNAAFFQIWTAKEALIKAMGIGLSLPLDSFDVALELVSGPRLLATRPNPAEAARWRIQGLPAPGGYAAALATESHLRPPLMLVWHT
jgi:4'-phosphopantetheinyl transferase